MGEVGWNQGGIGGSLGVGMGVCGGGGGGGCEVLAGSICHSLANGKGCFNWAVILIVVSTRGLMLVVAL